MEWYIIIGLLCFTLGYITKDLLTIEKKIEVNVRKQKVKGRGNTLDADIQVDIKEEKKERKPLFARIRDKRKINKNK